MGLIDLGFNIWPEPALQKEKLNGYQLARVTAVDKESFFIKGEQSECRAELTGRMWYAASSALDYPTVGDWVFVHYFDDGAFAVIHEIVPRKNLLKRKTAGKRIEFQLIAANIDTAFILQSLDSDFSMERLERYLVIAAQSDIRPLILLSKSDLSIPGEARSRLSEIERRLPGVRAISYSSFHEQDVRHISELMAKGETFCLLGSSGVGKTTLLNRLLGEEAFRTRATREKDDKGRHATTRRQLTVLENGAILIDTPGMRELGAFDVERGIEDTFGAITELTGNCRFADCTHTQEKGCAVLEALEKGTIAGKQYENFMKMVRESRHYSMSYSEKRRKDKGFGKMVRSVKRTKKQNRESGL